MFHSFNPLALHLYVVVLVVSLTFLVKNHVYHFFCVDLETQFFSIQFVIRQSCLFISSLLPLFFFQFSILLSHLCTEIVLFVCPVFPH